MVRNLNQYRFNYFFLFCLIFLTFTFLPFFALNSSAATQVTLEWDPNSEPDLAGYRIFCREQSQSYDYTNPSWEGADISCTIYDLDETKTYCFVARAFDTYGNESGNSIELCKEPSVILNQPPIADAGPDQTISAGQMVSLNGSNSTDPDDSIASYHWIQIGDPVVSLSNPDAMKPTFTTPDVGTGGAALTFELTVMDLNGNQAKDTCVVNVTWQNEPPQANAGLDQTVDEGVVVSLDGTSSLDIDDGIVSYQWTQIGVPAVTLSNPSSPQPTFTAPNVESDGISLTFNLTVTDTGGLKNTDSCIVNITWQNEPPTAVVTPDYTETTEGTVVELDGSGSTDVDDGIASYLWSQVEGDPVSLSDPSSAVTTFTAPKSDPLGKNVKVKLTVKDHGGLQSTADSDTEDGDLTVNLVWTSNLDGQIGTGGSAGAMLSDGTHTITASVTDSGSLTGNASVTITVGSGEDSINLNVTADYFFLFNGFYYAAMGLKLLFALLKNTLSRSPFGGSRKPG